MKPVWIVDDDRSIRWVIEKALSREGIAFSSFSSAQDALDALGASSPEVLVSDIFNRRSERTLAAMLPAP